MSPAKTANTLSTKAATANPSAQAKISIIAQLP
jgi:hypothetical protein